jgi:hypothetical protein
MYIRTYVYVRIRVHTYVCMHVCMHVRMYVCMYVHTCMYMIVLLFDTDIIVLPARALQSHDTPATDRERETTITPLFAPPEPRTQFARLKVLCIHLASKPAGAGLGGGCEGEGGGHEESDRWVAEMARVLSQGGGGSGRGQGRGEKGAEGGGGVGKGAQIVVQILSGLICASYQCESVHQCESVEHCSSMAPNDVTDPLASRTPTNSRRIFLDTPPEKGGLNLPSWLAGGGGGEEGDEGRGGGGAGVGGGCVGEEEGVLGPEGKVSFHVALCSALCCGWEEGGGMQGGRGGREGEGEGGKANAASELLGCASLPLDSSPVFPLSARGELFVRVCIPI